MLKFRILGFLIFTVFTCNAQIDTLNYLKQFEANKIKYIGKPFSVLLNDMTQIQPKTYWSFPSGMKKNISYDTTFYFGDNKMIIVWQNPIPRDQTYYYEQKNKRLFTIEEKNFYGFKIIKNIIVYRKIL